MTFSNTFSKLWGTCGFYLNHVLHFSASKIFRMRCGWVGGCVTALRPDSPFPFLGFGLGLGLGLGLVNHYFTFILLVLISCLCAFTFNDLSWACWYSFLCIINLLSFRFFNFIKSYQRCIFKSHTSVMKIKGIEGREIKNIQVQTLITPVI